MGRKIEMKKIEDSTKCQVTFSKRRTSLVEKAEKISFICDVDVGLIAFSPSDHVTKFCSRERIEDLLDRYVNLTPEKRLSHIKNVQAKMQKLKALETIRDDDGKLQYLNDQIQNLKVQIEKKQMEMQLAEANLSDFELNPAHEISLHQLSWCERNLQQCFEKVNEKKKEKLLMENGSAEPCFYNQVGNSLHSVGSSSCYEQLQMQFESWINSQYMYQENMCNEMFGKGEGKELADTSGASEISMQNNTLNVSVPTSCVMHQFGIPETQTWEQINLAHEYPQQYGQNYASDTEYQLWKEAPMQWQHAESSSLFEEFAGESSCFADNYVPNYWSAFPESYTSNIPNTLTGPSNSWEMSVLQNQPSRDLKNTQINANKEDVEGDSKSKVENEDAYNEMIISPSPPVIAPALASAAPTDLYDPVVPLEDNPQRNQEIQDTEMWDWNIFKNLNIDNLENFDL